MSIRTQPDRTSSSEAMRNRVLILTPTDKDAAVATEILGNAEIQTHVCRSVADLCRAAVEGAGAALVPEELLIDDQEGRVFALLRDQPTWSDLPLIVLLVRGSHSSEALNRLQALGNVTLVTRPVRIAPFVSTVAAKLRDRARQYAVRDLLAERSRANASIRRKEQRLSMALRAGGMAAWEWRPDGVYWSEGVYGLFAYDQKVQPSIEKLFDRVHADDLAAVRRAWTKSTSEALSYNLEFRIVRPDGQERWVAAVGEPVPDAQGNVVQIAGLFWDITDRKEAELRERFAAETERFLADASLVLGSSLDYEKTLAKITQLCLPTLADWAFLDLVDDDETVRRVHVAHPEGEDELASRVAQFPARTDRLDHPPARALFEGEAVFIPEFTEAMLVKAAQNQAHEQVMREVGPKSFIVVPLIARGARFGVLTLMATDTGRRYGPQDVGLARELARRAAVAIDNARLYEAGKQASAAKSEFLANMSHEIRTPMTAVLGYTDLLMAGEEDAEKLDFLRTIKRNGQFLLEIINDILDLSKIEAGKLDIVRQSFSIEELVTEVHTTMAGRAAEKDLGFTLELVAPVPPQIESDPKRLRQILVNLIGNAIKFTDQGQIRIRVRHRREDDRSRLQIDVVDTGIGMTVEQQGRLFQPFSQGDPSATRSIGGTGLGLAISQRLASMLGGEIRVKSQQGEGSTFTCEIAAEAVAESGGELPDTTRTDRETTRDPQPERLSCRVLVVDDRREVLFLTRHFLKESGAIVESATDGVEAVEAIQRTMDGGRGFDLVLLDMQMPRLDGYETASRLRSMGFRQPIIALTADAMQGDRERCITAGCNGHLSKPINRDELIEVVAHYTSDRKMPS